MYKAHITLKRASETGITNIWEENQDMRNGETTELAVTWAFAHRF